MREELQRAFDSLWAGSESRQWIKGRLGRHDSDGTITIKTGRPGFVHVSLGAEGDQGVGLARNLGVPLKPFLPIRMRIDPAKGYLVIHGQDYGTSADTFDGTGGTKFAAPPHTHALRSGYEYPIEALRINPGRPQCDTGLNVTVQPFRYYWNGTWDTYMGTDTLDMTSYLPATTDYWAWIVVALNPNTNLLTAITGDEYATQAELTIDLIDDIDTTGLIPLGAVQANEADTSLSDIDDWQDARCWLNHHVFDIAHIPNVAITSASLSDGQTLRYDGVSTGNWVNQALVLDDLGDVIIAGVTENDSLWFDGSTWVNGAGHRLNEGAVQALTISSAALNIDGTDKQHGLIDVRGEGSADDTLSTINGGNVGDVVFLTVSDSSTYGEISIDAAGNILVPGTVRLTSTAHCFGVVKTAAGWLPILAASQGDAIELRKLGTPEHDTLEDWVNAYGATGHISGGDIADAGGASVTVGAGEGMIRAVDDELSTLFFGEWAALAATGIPSNTERFVGVNYNSGTPTVTIETTENDSEDRILLHRVYNENGTLHFSDLRDHLTGGLRAVSHALREVLFIRRAEKVGGLLLGETGTRNLTVTTGKLYYGETEYSISAIDTSGADTFDAYYRDGVGGWTKQAAQTQWNNTQYDDNSGTLATMTANRYGEHWLYLEIDGGLVLLYGRQNAATQATVEAADAPASLPPRLVGHATLIGRIIFQKSAASAALVQSAFSTVFTASSVGGATTVDSLTDAVITSVADNEVFAFDSGSGNWINQTAAEAALATASHTHSKRLNFGSRQDVTIATGVADITSYSTISNFNIRGESAAADDLDTISGSITEGDCIVITGANETITVKDGTGNINCAGDRTLNSGADVMMLLYDGSAWNEVVHTSNA